MTFTAKIKIQYTSKWDSKGGICDNEELPEENVIFEVPAEDLNTVQFFKLFRNFMLAIGHNQRGIDKGAMSLVFNEMRDIEDMRKVAEEYDLKLQEDLSVDEKWNEQNKVEPNHWEHRYWELRSSTGRQITDLKAKLSRALNPDNPNYTESEMDALCMDNDVTVDTLKNADVVCKDCGTKYGHYSVSCSSTWMGTCNVCGLKKPITEVRDWNWLKEGIDKLSK